MNLETSAPRSAPSPRAVLRERTVAEFFAGIGLMRLGLEQDGWSVAFANDIAADKHAMYADHFQDADPHFVVQDVHRLAAASVPTVALATASFPCNDLSLAGMRQGLGGKQSSAYWGFIRVLTEMGPRRPPLVLLENVAGLLTSHGGQDFHAVLLALNRLGYVVDPMIVDAAHFVPQSRVRLFVIGSRQRESRRTPGSYESEIRPKAMAAFIADHPEISWNISRPAKLPTRRSTLADIVEDLPPDSPFWWSAERRDYLISQMSERHAARLGEMMQGRDWSYGTVFRRVRKGTTMAELRTDGIAGCLRTPRGGSARQILVAARRGKAAVRLLSPAECARLMGADGFAVDGSLNRALFGFGDAVCVPVIRWIARNYLTPLTNVGG